MLKPIYYKAFFENKIASKELRGGISTTDTYNTNQQGINRRDLKESLKKDIDYFQKDVDKNKWRTINEVIDQGFFEKNNPFEEPFLEICNTFANVPQNIPNDTKDFIK